MGVKNGEITMSKQRYEYTWIGKNVRPKLKALKLIKDQVDSFVFSWILV